MIVHRKHDLPEMMINLMAESYLKKIVLTISAGFGLFL